MRYLLPILCMTMLLACRNDDDNANPCPNPESESRYFLFHHESGAQFTAWTDRPAVLAKVEAELSLPYNERTMHINGAILEDDKTCAVNPGWTWYFDPADWDLTDFSIELCDGNPQYVEDHLSDYVHIGRYCPWSSRVFEEIDRPF